MDVLSTAARLRSEGKAFVLATVTWRRAPSSGRQGAKAIIHPDGRVEGWMGGACAEPTIVREALEALQSGSPRVLVLGAPDPREGVVVVPMACSSEGAMEVYVEPMLPKPHLHVIGSSPMSHMLCRLAETLGWRVTAVDEADVTGIDADSYVIVATQGHYDEPAVEAALAQSVGFVGLVASEKRSSAVREYLRGRGVGEEDLARLRAPVGIDLGHIDHEEIAVAILAELVGVRAAAPGGPTRKVMMPEQAVDPVCHMTVDVDTARWTAEHEGTTYYFCAPGCKTAFEKDPASFL